jgi:hypothetical protein
MSSSLSLLKEEFRSRAESPDNLFLLSAVDAVEFVQCGERLKLRLAGVEAFRMWKSGAFQPVQDFSNDSAEFDLSNDEFVKSTLELIRKGGASGLWFQVVFE